MIWKWIGKASPMHSGNLVVDVVERAEAEAEINRLMDALKEISKGMGRFSRDPLTHADNTIEDMKRLANKALEGKPLSR